METAMARSVLGVQGDTAKHAKHLIQLRLHRPCRLLSPDSCIYFTDSYSAGSEVLPPCRLMLVLTPAGQGRAPALGQACPDAGRLSYPSFNPPQIPWERYVVSACQP